MEMFTELPNDRESIVKVGTHRDQGIRVEDDGLILGQEEGHRHSDGQRDKQRVHQLTAMARHLGYDQSTLQTNGLYRSY